jgi:XTP/dITP diphosphohydrolase
LRPPILLATRSAGKIREIRGMTAAGEWQWRSLADFPDVAEAPETGGTLSENARQKALFYAAATGLAALADDSGLEVDALGGLPGVDSAYFAGQPRDDAANNRKLVAALAAIPLAKRTARFRCCMALAVAGRVVLEATGSVDGVIIDIPRGTNGFGYDPHFLLPERGVTTAELAADEKNAISHRGRALREMLALMESSAVLPR